MTDVPSQRAPYPGLRAFRREETDLFFGREDSLNAMVDRLAATRFLAVLGSSGTGKSSLVRTGLLDALELGLMAKAGSRWTIVEFRPGGAPLKNLARRLLETESGGEKPNIAPQDVDLLRAFLARGPRAVIEWCAGHLPKGGNLLLLVDQFEELFRYQDYAGREEAEAFVALLLESAREAEVPIYVTITMRSEYLGACALIEGLADAINAGIFLTPRMTREHCREAIVGPAAVCNIDIEPALVNRLLNDLANFAPWDDRDANDQLDRLMRRADQLPLLQYTLNRMWQRARERSGGKRVELAVDDYEAIEGLGGALNAHANQIFEQLGKERAQVAEWVFRALTAGSTIADAVRRPTRLEDLIAACGGDETGVRAVIDAFRAPGVNFLVPEYDPNHPRIAPDTYIDISHESLIRQWKRLSEWVAAEGRAAQQWRRLVDRYGTGEMLRGRELANLIAWRAETRPNAAWARRYGGDYPAVIGYLGKSHRAQNTKRVTLIAAIAASFALNTGIAVYALQKSREVEHQRQMVEHHQTFFTKAFSDLFYSLQAPLAASHGATQASPRVRAASQPRAEAASREDVLDAGQPEAQTPEIPPDSVDRITSDVETRQSLALTTVTILEETARKLYKSNPSNIEFQRLFVVGLINLGDAKLQNKDVDGAETAFNEGLTIVSDMLVTNPAETVWLDDQALAFAGLGRVKVQRADYPEARKHFEQAIEIERRFIVGQPDDRLLRNLQIHLGELGELHVRFRELVEARKIFEERLEVRRRRLKLNPRDSELWADVSVALDRVGQLIRDQGDLNGSRKYFEQALKIDRELLRISPSRRSWQENLVFSLTRIGDLEFRLARYGEALPPYEDARELQRRIVGDLNAVGPLQTMASILGRVGDIKRRLKDFPGSISAHREELELRRRLLARDQDNLPARRSVANALDYLGNSLRESKDLTGARAAFTEQLQIDRGIVKADSESTTSLLDLAWSLNRLGDLDRDATQPLQATAYYEEALGIQRKLYIREPQNAARIRALALILGKLGTVRSRLNEHTTALLLHREELELRQNLYERATEDGDALRDLSLANDRVGNVLRDMKDFKGALKYYLEELQLDRGYVIREPDNLTALVDLQWTLNKVTDFIRQRLGDREGARAYLEEMIGIDRRLIELQPTNRDRHKRLRDDRVRLAELLLELNDPEAARRTYVEVFIDDQRWLAIVRETFMSASTDANRNELSSAYSDAGWDGLLAGRPEEALPLIEAALALRPDTPWNLVNLGHVHLFLGRYDEALKLFTSVRDRNRTEDGKRTYAHEIRDDFAIFRRLKLIPPAMDRIERELKL